ncbi:MAG: hypothetical protein ACOY5C_02790 [Pseudomonadota bacterium]
MTTIVQAEIRSRAVREAFRRAPAVMERHLGRAVRRGAAEIAREARGLAPKAHATLTQSIRDQALSPLVSRVAAGVAYAAYVEAGTGPGGRPSARSLLDWIKAKGISPRDPTLSPADLAFVLSRAIAARGTRAQPFLRPAAQRQASRVLGLLRESVDAGLREAFGA